MLGADKVYLAQHDDCSGCYYRPPVPPPTINPLYMSRIWVVEGIITKTALEV